jgi:hypothetical protein
MVHYKVSIQPTGTSDANTVATQLIAGISTSIQNTTFVAGSGSRYKDDFQRALTVARNTSYIPRTCRIVSSTIATTNYFLNAKLAFTGTPISIRAHYESYMYAIKIQ